MVDRVIRSLFACFILLFAVPLLAAGPTPPPPAPFEPKTWPTLSDQLVSPRGKVALAFKPERWLHGESEHFVIHYRRITEAKRVALEIEYHLWFVLRALSATPESYRRKSHVFIFEDEKDWAEYKAKTDLPVWSASLAIGDELYLNLRDGRTGLFDSKTLAHETTHAVVARLYPGRRWPRWLNEGFAETISGVSVAARMGQYARQFQRQLPGADYPLATLIVTEEYPSSPVEVAHFYQSSERLVRFLLNDHPPEKFPNLVDALLDGGDFRAAVTRVFPERYPDWPAFEKRFERYKQLNP